MKFLWSKSEEIEQLQRERPQQLKIFEKNEIHLEFVKFHGLGHGPKEKKMKRKENLRNPIFFQNAKISKVES